MNVVPLETEQRVPHSIEAEQALLGAILLKNDAMDSVTGIVQAGHFFDPLHGRIFEISQRLINQGKIISPITLGVFFENEAPLGSVTVKQYLGRLVSQGVTLGVVDYAKTIVELSIARSGIIIAEDLSNGMYNRTEDSAPSQVLDEMLDRMFKLTTQTEERKSVDAGSVALDVIAKMTDQSQQDFIPTGLEALNRIIGGYHKGEVIYVGGRPGMGKSAFAHSEALKAAKAGYGVAIFSLEMGASEIVQRMLSDLVFTRGNEIQYSDIRNQRVEAYQRDRLLQAQNVLEGLALEIYDKRGISVTEISAQIRQIARKFQRAGKTLDIVFIDYLGKIKTTDRYKGMKNYELGEVSNEITIMADHYKIPFVVLHQLNRDVEGRQDKRPTIADFKSTGDIEQDAHVVLFPFRQVYYLKQDLEAAKPEEQAAIAEQIDLTKNEINIIVAKERNGAGGVVRAEAYMGSNAIRNKR